MSKNIYAILVLSILSTSAWACHGVALTNLTVTTNATDIVINASSDAASCGCGPYWMEVELSSSMSFTGVAPAPSSSSWGTYPWYHSLLNVPNYNAANGWPDNCLSEPYTTINLPLSSFCAGATVYMKMREYVEGSASAGPWSAAVSVVVPGSPPTLAGSASASPQTLCLNDSTLLAVSHNGCSGNYVVTWTPAATVASPASVSTYAFPTVTTTYTVSFTDVGLGQTFTSTVTVSVNTPPVISLSSTIESCNASDADITSSVTGNAPFTFLWSNASATANLTNISSGNYTVDVTDANGCVGTQSITVTDSCDYVWPGDANDDATADINDILAIGLANGATGASRVGASITWIGQYCAPWGLFAPVGVDEKFIDCNGDGTVNANDTTAVVTNFGFVHNNRWANQEPNGSSPTLSVNFVQDTIAPSSPGSFMITLGDAAVNANSFYGLTFTLNYDETYIDPQSLSVSATGSWLGTIGTDLIVVKKIYPGMGMMDVAVTRMDQQNRTGMGMILTFSFLSTSALTGTGTSATTMMSIGNVNTVTNNGSYLFVNLQDDSITITDDFMLGINSVNSSPAFVYPNPASTQITVHSSVNSGTETFVLYNSLGQEVKRTQLVKQDESVSCSDLSPGIYFYSVLSGGQVTGRGNLIKE